ncbi:MAG TPA: hypothetical protein VE343_13330 [Streptosporangiaceae bacterium]|nr:hypothetical protein [Streptosporangiaceae bacterium]
MSEPVIEPQQPAGRRGRARWARGVLAHPAAGWVVAAALLGALVPVSVGWATSPSAVTVNRPFAGPGGVRVLPGMMQVGPPGAPGGLRPGRVHARMAPPFAQVVPGGRIAKLPPLASGRSVTTPFGSVVSGTVGTVSGSGFTLKTAAGRTLTVTEQPSTSYRKAGQPASASAVTRGARVLVLGTQSGSKLSASAVAVLR